MVSLNEYLVYLQIQIPGLPALIGSTPPVCSPTPPTCSPTPPTALVADFHALFSTDACGLT